MTLNEQTLIALNVALFLQLFGMIFALIIDPYIGKQNKIIMLISAVLTMSLIIQQYTLLYHPVYHCRYSRLSELTFFFLGYFCPLYRIRFIPPLFKLFKQLLFVFFKIRK